MEENLVGYLMKCLEPEEMAQTEAALRADPAAQGRLENLRRALHPLECDREEIEPPGGLWLRTLARVAELQCKPMPQAPVATIIPGHVPPRHWLMRSDILVAASLLLCFGLIVPPGLGHMRHREQIVKCQQNLETIGQGLIRYTDLDRHAADGAHQKGAFPHPANFKPPYDVAGLFVPALIDAGVLTREGVSVRCPGTGAAEPPRLTLAEYAALPPGEFERQAKEITPSYAYALGYQGPAGKVLGPTRTPGARPLVSDSPPLLDDKRVNGGNTMNHAAQGQNILFTDGHVRFHTTRSWNGDDIFVNEDHQSAAGHHRGDHVLGSSASRALPIQK